ncbi:MAG: hypothetical protein H6797_04930 [Candidatus Nomurabacteria bacterium]|nr:MAG: hypothetical protein H6797_04930 [Candidatus Nomurabacteria bacterium]
MLAFNHMLAGSIVAVVVPAPLVPVVAFASHFALDLFPHAYGEEPPYSRFLKIQVVIDTLVSLAVILFLLLLFPDKYLIVGVGAFFGFLPDLLWVFWRKGIKWLDKFLDWAHWIQWGERRYGWIFDAFYGMVMCITLYILAGQPWG